LGRKQDWRGKLVLLYATGRRREWNGVDTHAASFTRRSSRLSAAAALTVLGLGLAGMAGRRWRQRKA